MFLFFGKEVMNNVIYTGYSEYILAGGGGGALAQPKRGGGSWVRAKPKGGGGLRCGHNQKNEGPRCAYNPKKGVIWNWFCKKRGS